MGMIGTYGFQDPWQANPDDSPAAQASRAYLATNRLAFLQEAPKSSDQSASPPEREKDSDSKRYSHPTSQMRSEAWLWLNDVQRRLWSKPS